MLTVRIIATSIAKCLRTMHLNQVIHGDVKNRNFVLLPSGEYAAVDLDAAAEFGQPAGLKPTSSGCLPPEQAEVVLHRRRRAADAFQHGAAAPAQEDELSAASPERFHDDDAAPAPAPAQVVASPSYDAWGFGVMLYELATGRTLFQVDVREEVDDAELAKIAEWSDAHKRLKLGRVVTDRRLWRLLDQLLHKDPARRLTSWDNIISALENEDSGAGLVSRDPPAQTGQAWVKYDGMYFTADGDDRWNHDEVYRQNPLLDQAVGTEDDPRAGVLKCTQGGGKTGEHGEATKLRQDKYSANKGCLASQMAEELQKAEDLKSSSRTVHAARYRPVKGAWVQYGDFCYTANGPKSWSHDEVYAQNPLLALAAGAKDDPKAEIMDVTQGSGPKVSSGEATKLRQASYRANSALIAKQMLEDLRVQKAAASRANKKAKADAARVAAAGAPSSTGGN